MVKQTSSKPVEFTLGGKPIELSAMASVPDRIRAFLKGKALGQLFTQDQIAPAIGVSVSTVRHAFDEPSLKPFCTLLCKKRVCGSSDTIIELRRRQEVASE